MWIYNVDGMFSVVSNKFCKPGEVAVRARCEDDLKRFLERAGCPDLKIMEFEFTDYRFRVHVSKDVWSVYLHRTAQALDYSNFKDAAVAVDVRRYQPLYMVWASTLNHWPYEGAKS